MAFDRQVSSITLTGSILSSIATLGVLCCFVVFRKNQRTFRHALVLNLTIADFINAIANVVSGSIYIRDQKLVDSPSCVANGWIEQFSVQATDFSILAISIATLLVVTQKARLISMSTTKTLVICLSVWVLPLITSTTATVVGAMKPVSGNWCWITKDRTDLRYGLTHGWRFVIIAITIGAYSYVWWYLSRHFKAMRSLNISTPLSNQSNGENTGSQNYAENEDPLPDEEVVLHPLSPRYIKTHGHLAPATPRSIEMKTDVTHLGDKADEVDLEMGSRQEPGQFYQSPGSTTGHSTVALTETDKANTFNRQNTVNGYMRDQTKQKYKEIKRMLLLNGYPLLYVILWIPGIINRVMEATGSGTSSRVLNILQCSTQYIGFANAITYGLNQQWRAGR